VASADLFYLQPIACRRIWSFASKLSCRFCF